VDAERWLKLLLRVVGGAMVLAVFGVLMPRGWMAACHRWMGLGEFPAGPMIEYLARMTSGLYAMAGVVFLVAAGDVRRYGPVITVFAVGFLVMAPVVLAFLVCYGSPMIWYAVGDVATAVPAMVLILFLQARVRRQDRLTGKG